MIPTLIMVVQYLGAGWQVTLLVSAVGWPAPLVSTSAARPWPAPAGAAGLAVLGTGAGVLLHQGIRHRGRKLRRALAAGRPNALGLPVQRWRG